MTFDDYLRLTWSERIALHLELDDIIERTSPEEGEGGIPARPRRQRK